LRSALLAGLLPVLLCSSSLVWQAGHPVAAVILFMGLLAQWISLIRDPAAGSHLHWRAGVWFLQQQGEHIEIELIPQGSRLPWVLYIPWRERATGRYGSLWLFSDSLGQASLRRLRARLVLEG
jgi:hypothetical protein